MQRPRTRTTTTITFSERGNPGRRYVIEQDEPISEFHDQMMQAFAGHRQMRSLPQRLNQLPRLEELFASMIQESNSQQTLDTIPSYTAEGDIAECSVCQEKIKPGEKFRRLPCSNTVNHCFHTDCIDQWLKSNSTCPNCRANIFN